MLIHCHIRNSCFIVGEAHGQLYQNACRMDKLAGNTEFSRVLQVLVEHCVHSARKLTLAGLMGMLGIREYKFARGLRRSPRTCPHSKGGPTT